MDLGHVFDIRPISRSCLREGRDVVDGALDMQCQEPDRSQQPKSVGINDSHLHTVFCAVRVRVVVLLCYSLRQFAHQACICQLYTKDPLPQSISPRMCPAVRHLFSNQQRCPGAWHVSEHISGLGN